jgi:peptide/nickel transport system permease protein
MAVETISESILLSERRGFLRAFRETGTVLWSDRYGRIGCCILLFFVVLAILAPFIVPYDPWFNHRRPDGQLARLDSVSSLHWFGTTYNAQDVFTQTILGTRLALMVGLITAVLIGIIGTNVGLISGYFGGRVDDCLMRLTDVAYGIPFLPFMVVVASLVGPRLDVIIFSMAMVFWRSAARVVRSQVLSLKERPYILAARSSGASHLRILYVHLFPNVLPLAFLYLVFGVAWAVLNEASLSFIGLGDPNKVSWGLMLHHAFNSGAIRVAWWWVVPPGCSLMLLLVGCYLVGRAYEERVNPRLRGRE